MSDGAMEQMLATTGSKATYTGAGTAFFGWFTASEFIGLVGLFVAIAGLVVNWYYRHKDDKRMQAEHEARMSNLG
jgi:hypothetical protein